MLVRLLLLGTLCLSLTIGCSSQPKASHLSGMVTFKGARELGRARGPLPRSVSDQDRRVRWQEDPVLRSGQADLQPH